MSSADEQPHPGDIIDGRFEVIRELGEGGFGAVVEVVDRKSKGNYAMKIELEVNPPDEPGLDTEAAILRKLRNKNHIIQFIAEGKIGKRTYVVMQLVGPSLSELRKQCDGRHFSLSTCTRVAIQTLDAIEVVHESGFLHRDIKPGNFAIGLSGKDKRQIYILDFGLVRRYRMRDGAIRPERPNAGFRGSVRYASINCHNHKDLGRHDDIWSWLYSVVEMQIGSLPWSAEEDDNKVLRMKTRTKRRDLLKHMRYAYHEIYKSLERLKYESRPPYRTYKEKLKKILRRRNIRDHSKYDWEKKKKTSRTPTAQRKSEISVKAVITDTNRSKKDTESA